MSEPSPRTPGVIVSLNHRCDRCRSAVAEQDEACGACAMSRPEAGWRTTGSPENPRGPLAIAPTLGVPAGAPGVPAMAPLADAFAEAATHVVGGDMAGPVDLPVSGQGASDQGLAGQTPSSQGVAPPVAPARSPAVGITARRSAAAAPSPLGLYVRLIGVFVGSALLSGSLVVALGLQVLPRHAARPAAAPPSVQQHVPSVVAPPVALPPKPVAVAGPLDGVQVPVAKPAPMPDAPGVSPRPRVVSTPAPAVPTPAVPTPVVDLVLPELAAPTPQPVAAPASALVPAAADAVALNGTYVGKASGRPMSLSVHFDDAHQVSMVLRVAERSGAVTRSMSGHYTLAPDGSVDFALSERTRDGVVGYVGTLSAAGVEGIVTLDGRRRGRFFGGR